MDVPVTIDTCLDHQEYEERAILHVLVIGFHHKKGSQVDYCYPSFNPDCCYCNHSILPSGHGQDTVYTDGSVHEDGDDQLLPTEWKVLPSLCLPDGAHNFSSDSVFFHLPMVPCRVHGHSDAGDGINTSPSNEQSIKEAVPSQERIIYGVSCYRQVVASDSIKESDSSITRTTVMKAVVVLSRLPFYGLISAKVDSITRVYFGQKNFNNKSCLIELFNNLNYVLSKDQRDILSPTEAKLLSLSPTRYLLQPFGHRIMILIKLLLLEKKILFFSTTFNPSNGSSSASKEEKTNPKRSSPGPTITKMAPKSLSLSPKDGNKDKIRKECSCTGTTNNDWNVTDKKVTDKNVTDKSTDNEAKDADKSTDKKQKNVLLALTEEHLESSPSSSPSSVRSLCLSILTLSSLVPDHLEPSSKQYHLYCNHCQESVDVQSTSSGAIQSNSMATKDDHQNVDVLDASQGSGRKTQSIDEPIVDDSCPKGLPALNLFNFNQNHLHPYLDLSFIDAVANYKSCLIGATNGLYKQKKSSLFDVTVDVVTGKIDFETSKDTSNANNQDWKRALSLTNEDLRFADFICKHCLNSGQQSASSGLASDDNCDSFEGSDDWIRIQVNLYLLHLIKTVLMSEFVDNYKELITFNINFVNLWKKSENFQNFRKNFFSQFTNHSNHDDNNQAMETINRTFGSIKCGHPYQKSGHVNQVSSAMADLKLRFTASGYASSLFGAKNLSATDASVSKSAILSSAKASLTNWYTSTIPSLMVSADNGSEASEDQNQEDQKLETPEKVLRKDFESVSLSKLLKSQDKDDDCYELASDAVQELN